ncbi:acyltransferase, partial [Aliarcobacter butzleri]
NTTANSWPTLTANFVKSIYVEQQMSLVIMMAYIVIFVLKKVDNKILAIYGVYSYEGYLIHWTLIGRYDFFFVYLPS